MICFRPTPHTRVPRAGVIATFVVSALLAAGQADAQVDDLVTRPVGEQGTAPNPASAAAAGLRRSLAAVDFGSYAGPRRQPPPAFQASSGGRQRSTGRKVVGGVIGAVGGFFGGGFLGAAIEGDRCNCDDPGWVGFWIGAPIGTVVGAIVGAKLF